MTIGIATAAGARHYTVPDAGVDQTIAFLRGATPQLAAEILVPPSGRTSAGRPDPAIPLRTDVASRPV
ncbi:hypothetical protein M1L60_33935 [Actinoplanes sp. TRM 88003]|uniref:Uncharacterized protein n=1 Tax=Paractinoplanes aksuensis TaxID=2939490 RepID=A0ABT1DXJ6_9ACTN|nr:hypothetical protein [Actinoplanes aksuensis]MCO8275597.1 hypothetical protein [Actinoplanes aksuensis]